MRRMGSRKVFPVVVLWGRGSHVRLFSWLQHQTVRPQSSHLHSSCSIVPKVVRMHTWSPFPSFRPAFFCTTHSPGTDKDSTGREPKNPPGHALSSGQAAAWRRNETMVRLRRRCNPSMCMPHILVERFRWLFDWIFDPIAL